MITFIDLPLALWLIAPNKRYHFAGGQLGPYGDTLDAIRLETTAPAGEELLTALPSEAQIIRVALDHCAEYPALINWAAIPPGATVAIDGEIIQLDAYRGIE